MTRRRLLVKHCWASWRTRNVLIKEPCQLLKQEVNDASRRLLFRRCIRIVSVFGVRPVGGIPKLDKMHRTGSREGIRIRKMCCFVTQYKRLVPVLMNQTRKRYCCLACSFYLYQRKGLLICGVDSVTAVTCTVWMLAVYSYVTGSVHSVHSWCTLRVSLWWQT
jgi:hypothetical protein